MNDPYGTRLPDDYDTGLPDPPDPFDTLCPECARPAVGHQEAWRLIEPPRSQIHRVARALFRREAPVMVTITVICWNYGCGHVAKTTQEYQDADT